MLPETHVLKNLIRDIFKSKPGPCVVCGEPTLTKFSNRNGGRDYVHDYHEPEYLGCKEVWQYRQDKPLMYDRDILEALADEGDGDAADILLHSPERVISEVDFYQDYKSYIQSREWQLKANSLKRSVGWCCQSCGVQTRQLDVHHKHYRTLYNERRRDLMVLCRDCHEKVHHGS